MKILIIVLSQLPTLLCLSIAGYLAVKDLPGWGWFNLAGGGDYVMCMPTACERISWHMSQQDGWDLFCPQDVHRKRQ